MAALVRLGIFIGVNGRSLIDEEGCNLVKKIPIDFLILDTGCPFNDPRGGHAGTKYIKTFFPRKAASAYNPHDPSQPDTVLKYRNEPCQLV